MRSRAEKEHAIQWCLDHAGEAGVTLTELLNVTAVWPGVAVPYLHRLEQAGEVVVTGAPYRYRSKQPLTVCERITRLPNWGS